MTETNSAEKQHDEKHSRQSIRTVLIYAVALAASCVAITQYFFPAHFETVDDLNFTLLLSGVGLTHAPTYQTWFTNVLITYPLMWLFQWNADIAWYSIYLFSVLTAGFSIVAAVLMLRFNRRLGAGLFLIYYISIGAYIVNGLQYTSATALLTQAAVLLAFCLPLTNRFPARRFPNWVVCLTVITTIFASLIRFEPFMLVLLFSAITVFAVTPGKLASIKAYAKPIACFVVAVIIGFALKTANNYYYDRQPAFAGIRDFFQPFSKIADSDRVLAMGTNSDLTENDYHLVKQFFVADKKVFTTEALSQTVAKTELPFTIHKLQWVLTTNVIPLVLLCLSIAWLLDPRLMSRKAFLVWLTGLVTLVLYLAFFMKLPTRVHLTLMTCAMTTLFMFMDRKKLMRIIKEIKTTNSRKKIILIGAFCVIAGWLPHLMLSRLEEEWQFQSKKGEWLKAAIPVLAPKPQQLFIVIGTDTPYQYLRPFQNPRQYFSNFDIYRTSLWGRVPVGENMLKAHGYSNLFEACKSPDVFFISNPKANALFARFLEEHYQMKSEFTLVNSAPNIDIEVYSLKLSPS